MPNHNYDDVLQSYEIFSIIVLNLCEKLLILQ